MRFRTVFVKKHEFCLANNIKLLLDNIPCMEYYIFVWNVEYTDEFNEWWETLDEKEQDAIDRSVMLLEDQGPSLSYPHSSDIRQSRHGNMRELRSQCKGHPLRTFYAYDPRRSAILLIGGDKAGNNNFYDEMVPKADKIYDEYLKEIKEEKK